MDLFDKIKTKTTEIIGSIDWDEIKKTTNETIEKAEAIRNNYKKQQSEEKERRLKLREAKLNETNTFILSEGKRLEELEEKLSLMEKDLEQKKHYPKYILLVFFIFWTLYYIITRNSIF